MGVDIYVVVNFVRGGSSSFHCVFSTASLKDPNISFSFEALAATFTIGLFDYKNAQPFLSKTSDACAASVESFNLKPSVGCNTLGAPRYISNACDNGYAAVNTGKGTQFGKEIKDGHAI